VTATFVNPPTSELVTVDVTATGPAVRVTAAGEIDSTSAPVLRARFDSLLDDSVEEVTVDLTQVTFLDSAGLCVLAAAHRRAAGQGVRMQVLASSRAVIRPLQITGLWSLLGASEVRSDTGAA
jgi:anti-sigma B factor antagonist